MFYVETIIKNIYDLKGCFIIPSCKEMFKKSSPKYVKFKKSPKKSSPDGDFETLVTMFNE